MADMIREEPVSGFFLFSDDGMTPVPGTPDASPLRSSPFGLRGVPWGGLEQGKCSGAGAEWEFLGWLMVVNGGPWWLMVVNGGPWI